MDWVITLIQRDAPIVLLGAIGFAFLYVQVRDIKEGLAKVSQWIEDQKR